MLTPFSRRSLTTLFAGTLILFSLSVAAQAQTCTYGLINSTSPVQSEHQLCPLPSFVSLALHLSAAGTYPNQYLGKLEGSSLSSAATVTSTLLGNATGVSVTNLVLNTTPPPTAPPGDSGQYLYADVIVSASASSANLGLVLNVMQEGVQVLAAVDALTVQASPAVSTGNCPTDVTSVFTLTFTSPIRLFDTQLYTQVVTLRNTSGSNVSGPILIALRNLSSNAQLFAGNGSLACTAASGAPYQYVASGLAAGASAKVILTFTNSLVPQTQIMYQPLVLTGLSRP